MENPSFCKNIATIPQFSGTCWFNAILMAVFYSQNSRKILLTICDKWDKTNKFLMICKDILLKHYIFSKETVLFLNKFKPEVILFYMLKYFKNDILKAKFKNLIKISGYNSLAYHGYYIANIYKHLNVKCLDITYLKSTNSYLINFYKNLQFKYENDKILTDTNLKKLNLSFEKEKEEIEKILKDVPDILIFNHSDISSTFTNLLNIVNSKLIKENSIIADVYNPDFHSITIKGLDEYKDEIEFNGHKYKLESCLLNSYNTIDETSKSFHLVAGLTCKNTRYVYNGWDKLKSDKEKEIYESETVIACPLIKYPWNLNKHQQICFNPKQCNLYIVTKGKYCFSFNKIKNGTLIYVRADDDKDIINSKNIDDEINSLSNLSLNSDFADIVKDMHDIKTLTKDELITQLKAFDVVFDSEEPIPDKKELQKMLYEKLTYYFRVYINESSSLSQSSLASPLPLPLNKKRVRESSSSSLSSSSKRLLKKYNGV
jgi:hypothetical protein